MKNKLENNENLYKIRHSFAHLLAQAVKELYPNAKLGFGPPTETGFYYDFDFIDESITEANLKEIQTKMKKLISQKQSFERTDGDAESAIKVLEEQGETYKIENVKMLQERGVTNFSFYRNTNFVDLCEGPHIENTSELKADAFKLDRIAGAYWLGDEKNKMLTRIYGLAFESKAELDEFLKRRETAEKFDHKKLGKELDLYHQDDLVGKGLIMWHPNGTVIRDEIEKFAKEKEFEYGYKRVATPHISKSDLFKKSGHLAAYKESMFPPMVVEDDGKQTEYYLKPMNCPFHHLIYGSRLRSYRELPLRLAEYGTVYRYEQSGELSGLIRVRCMCMNDAHMYIKPDQFESEFKSLLKMYKEFYQTFRLKDYSFRLSIRGKDNQEKFIGDPDVWDKSEKMLYDIMKESGIDFYIGEGEAAFYGPKIDIQFKNLMGREETASTIQVDYLAAEKFDLKYIDENGEEQRPLILHRSPLSTHERFISFITEYYGGAFPTWCAPTQVCMIPVNSECEAYANALADELFQKGVRTEVDLSDNSFNKKIRANTMRKIPILLIIGQKEVESSSVTIRRYGVEAQQTSSKQEFIEELMEEIRSRRMDREPMGSII